MRDESEMKRFLEPRSVAVIGASRLTGPGSFNILENMVNNGFSGDVYPVNPNADEIMGRTCYHGVKDIPAEIDLAVISTPRTVVPRLVRECTEAGIRAIIVVGQGFADGDDEGKRLQAEMVRIAREGGARILGPNTFGIANAFNRFCSAYMLLDMVRVPLGVITQTGFFFVGIPGLTMVGKGIDLGNACDIGYIEGLECLEDDPDIRVIFLHIEGIPDGQRFMEVARRVTRKKPVLALKAGRSEAAAEAARSHTGALTGRDEVYHAAFRQCGVMRVSDADEIADMVTSFITLPPMRGKGIGAITITGAGGIIATDACERYGLHMARLAPHTMERISAMAPPWQQMGNPVDIWPASMIGGHPINEVMHTAMESLLADPSVHAVLLIFAAFAGGDGDASQGAFIDPAGGIFDLAERYQKPIVCWLYGSDVGAVARGMERTGKAVVYPTLDRAMRALARLHEYWEYVNAE
ncbi:MAG: CoA-binding protein [Chloroflexota bacterium]|nr:CoA-binding protein [Chloroflexota bacterium]